MLATSVNISLMLICHQRHAQVMPLLCLELFSDIVGLYWLLCFLFRQSIFLFFFVFGRKFITLISTFATPISNFHAFFLTFDFYWLPDFNNVRAPFFPDCQVSLYFLMNIEATCLQQSIIFNLIVTYNKYFTIRDDANMKSIKIVQFSRPHTPLVHLRPQFLNPLDLGRPNSN